MKDVHIIKGEPHDFVCNPKGLGWQIFEQMNKSKDKIAQACCNTGVNETYGEMLKRVVKVAMGLRKYNLTRDDVILLCSPTTFNDAVVWIASIFAGCKVASIDPKFSLMDINLLLKVVKPKLVFVIPEKEETIYTALKTNECPAEIVVFGHSDNHLPFCSFLVDYPEEDAYTPVPCADVCDTAVIAFSSGSTGLPKGICLSHRCMMSQLFTDVIKNFNFLGFTSLYWVSSFVLLVSMIHANATRFIGSQFSPNTFWHMVKSQKISGAFLPPHFILDLVDMSKMPESTTLKFVILGGAGISADQIRNVRKALPNILVGQAYGQTETGGATCVHQLQTPEGLQTFFNRPASVGKLKKGLECKIVDPDTEETLGPNQVGEMRIRSENLFSGYYNMDSSDCFDEEGWFKTGDLMYYDDDEYFYHVDRLKEIFKFRQIHIQPVLLESILTQHFAVLEAIIVGKPHPHDGHQPMALVKLRQGFDHVSPEEIKDFFNKQVDDFKQLRGGLHIVDGFPLTVTGKVSRKDLRKILFDNVQV